VVVHEKVCVLELMVVHVTMVVMLKTIYICIAHRGTDMFCKHLCRIECDFVFVISSQLFCAAIYMIRGSCSQHWRQNYNLSSIV
jgi:hypothetical protein